jgi:hypothetical protein
MAMRCVLSPPFEDRDQARTRRSPFDVAEKPNHCQERITQDVVLWRGPYCLLLDLRSLSREL